MIRRLSREEEELKKSRVFKGRRASERSCSHADVFLALLMFVFPSQPKIIQTTKNEVKQQKSGFSKRERHVGNDLCFPHPGKDRASHTAPNSSAGTAALSEPPERTRQSPDRCVGRTHTFTPTDDSDPEQDDKLQLNVCGSGGGGGG